MCGEPRPDFRIERLADQDREAFSCGDEGMDTWFHGIAAQHNAQGLAVVQLLIENATDMVIGFYTLSNYSVLGSALPKIGGKKMPQRMHVPMHLLGKLGIHKDYQRQGHGEMLVNDALQIAKGQTSGSASMGVVVDALNDTLVAWYKKLGFTVFPGGGRSLFITMQDIELID